MVSRGRVYSEKEDGTSCFKGTEFMSRKSVQPTFEADGHIVSTALSVLCSLRPNAGNGALFRVGLLVSTQSRQFLEGMARG